MAMTMPMSDMVMAPHWVMTALGLTFSVGVLFYLFRLCRPIYMARVNGYADNENEFWHGICLLAMIPMLTPQYVSVPAAVWVWFLPVGSLWYLRRALTYGRRLPYNKTWYDFAHAAMFFGMWWMYAHSRISDSPVFTWLFAGYWGWFGSYYLWRFCNDFRQKSSWLSFAQDVFHLTMAVVMVVMTVWPDYLMIM